MSYRPEKYDVEGYYQGWTIYKLRPEFSKNYSTLSKYVAQQDHNHTNVVFADYMDDLKSKIRLEY